MITDVEFTEALNVVRSDAGSYYVEQMEFVLKAHFADSKSYDNYRHGDKAKYLKRWTKKYLKGFSSRPSVRTGKPSGTVPDPLVKLIFEYRLDLGGKGGRYEAGHSAMMTIENIVGDFLEEYLDIKLRDKGWYCCWGSTVDAVDFCHRDGGLLQVKNSDNSENSSSSRVRQGTEIRKWFRRFSGRPNEFNWDALQELTGDSSLTEVEFRNFIMDILKNNPGCISITQAQLNSLNDLQA
jgi:hypothetical protein